MNWHYNKNTIVVLLTLYSLTSSFILTPRGAIIGWPPLGSPRVSSGQSQWQSLGRPERSSSWSQAEVRDPASCSGEDGSYSDFRAKEDEEEEEKESSA